MTIKTRALSQKPLVFVAMSGGVDSSVAAALLQQQGYRVLGFFMKNWSEAIGHDTNCPWETDQEDARKVAAKLRIPLYTLNFEAEYRKRVVDYFLGEYKKGRTPNPDVMCNKEIKFGLFFEKALKMGADFIATGHYIKISKIKNQKSKTFEYKLLRGIDSNKDQSYFLWALTQKQLARCIFPIGEFTKPQIRKMAADFGLPTYNKPDSQGICFMGEFDVWEFLKKRIKAKPGPIMTIDGQIIGEHEGLPFYTIGQRRHIKVGGTGPYYVVEKDFKTNTLVVADNNHSDTLYRKILYAGQVNWIGGKAPALPYRIEAQIRYRSASAPATIESSDGAYYKIAFDEPQRAITEGQSAVFYVNEEMVGGGVIEKIE